MGTWIKINESDYKYMLDSKKFVLFTFDNQNFKCISDEDICKELE